MPLWTYNLPPASHHSFFPRTGNITRDDSANFPVFLLIYSTVFHPVESKQVESKKKSHFYFFFFCIIAVFESWRLKVESSFFDCLQDIFFLDVYERQREEGYSIFS